MHLFDAFEESEPYQGAGPDDAYIRSLLAKQHFIAIVAMHEREVIGGLTAYELEKFEQDRREIYIYDLAVAENHRRKGAATTLIEKLKALTKKRNAYVIYVQADQGDIAAIRLYESLGTKEDVYHFDIPVDR